MRATDTTASTANDETDTDDRDGHPDRPTRFEPTGRRRVWPSTRGGPHSPPSSLIPHARHIPAFWNDHLVDTPRSPDIDDVVDDATADKQHTAR